MNLSTSFATVVVITSFAVLSGCASKSHNNFLATAPLNRTQQDVQKVKFLKVGMSYDEAVSIIGSDPIKRDVAGNLWGVQWCNSNSPRPQVMEYLVAYFKDERLFQFSTESYMIRSYECKDELVRMNLRGADKVIEIRNR